MADVNKTKKIQNTLFTVLCLLLACFLFSSHASASTKESKLKAVFLYQIAKFTSWPSSKTTSPTLTVCLYGTTPDIERTMRSIQGKKAKGKTIVIKHLSTYPKAKECHLLYVKHASSTEKKKIISFLQHSPVLLIGDMSGFAAQGADMNFFIKENRLRFQVNRRALHARGLRLSSRLLVLADSIN